MALRRPARACAEGGVVVQAIRQGDARVAAGVAAAAIAAVLALAVRLSADDLRGPAGAAALAGVVALAAGLALRRGVVVTVGLALLGAGYGLSLAGRELDLAAGLFAGGLAIAAELAFWSLEPGAAVGLGRAATARRSLVALAVAGGGAAAGTALLFVAADPVAGGVGLAVSGIAALAAIAVVGIVLARSLLGGER